MSGADTRQELDVTIYNQNLALVREVRQIDLPGGVFGLEFQDVPAQIEPRSLVVGTADDSELRIIEQNYEFDLMSQEKILQKYVGRELSWIQEDGSRITGRLLGMAAGPVYEVNEEVVFMVPGRIALPTLPDNLRARPTLVWKADAERRQNASVEASYLTRGLSWSADYVMQLSPEGTRADLQAWVSLDNRCGATFAGARLYLVAGDIHQAPAAVPPSDGRMMLAAKADYGAVSEEALYDYHLYSLPGQTTLKDAQIKQISLFETEDIKVSRRYKLETQATFYRGGGQQAAEQKVAVYYSFQNEEENHLGIPLPAGIFRVYGQASSGSRQLLGEDRIDHTPRDEEVELKVGFAFDLAAERIRTNYRRVSERVHESEFALTIRNHKDEDVVVEVVENVGGDWQVLQSSHEYRKLSASQIRFDLTVPADGETVLTYLVQVTY
ncbi:MAG: DUF4139 domain-containing protein [bacterium]